MTRTVTALRERRRGRVEVELDGTAWRTFPVGAVARAGLRVGRALDRETARTLAQEVRRAGALAQATRSLSASQRSRRALEDRLARAGHSEAAREAALDSLERAGVLDDARLAESRAETLARRGYGDAAIRADLARRLIPPEIAASAISALEPESERAARVLAGKEPSPQVLRRLASRGFSRDTLEDLAASAFAREP